MSALSSARNLLQVLWGTPFGLYTAGNFASLAGVWMQRLTVGWLTWQLTGSGTWLGIVAFADLFPSIVFAPIAGVASDRWPRIPLLAVLQAASAVVAGALLLVYASGMLDLWLLLAFTFILGILASSVQPIRLTVVSELVPRDHLTVAIATNAIAFNVARFVGPALAGFFIAGIGVGVAFAVHAATFVLFFAILLVLPRSKVTRDVSSGSVLGEFAEGLAYMFSHRGIAPLILQMTMVGFCIRPIAELLPGFAEQVFGTGADGLALMTSAIGVGAMLGGLWLAGRDSSRGQLKIIFGHALATSVLLLLFCFTTNIYLGTTLLVAVGLTMISAGIASQSVLQLTVPDRLRGRTISTYGMIIRVSPAVGALIVGVMSEWMGLQMAMALMCPLCLVVALVLLSRLPLIGAEIAADKGMADQT